MPISSTANRTTVASHGYRWIDYQYMGEAAEREHIRKAVEITTQVGMYACTAHPSPALAIIVRTSWLTVQCPNHSSTVTTGLRHPPRGYLPGQAQHQHAAARGRGGGLPLVRPTAPKLGSITNPYTRTRFPIPTPNTTQPPQKNNSDSDCYSDDLPFWNTDYGRPHLVIPYTLDVNDMRFATPQGFNCGDQFFTYLKVCV